MIVGLYVLWKQVKGANTPAGKAREAIEALTGYNYQNGVWDIKTATAGIPMVAGVALSMVASKTGMNRYTPKGINI